MNIELQTTCDHTDAIARDLYTTYTKAVGGIAFNGDPLPGASEFFGDPTKKKQSDAWRAVAKETLPIIGRHALDDIKAYLVEKGVESSGWKKVLYWAGSIIAGGLVAWGVSGCGHDVVMTPDGTTVSKDGSTLIVQPGFLSFTQSAPEPTTPVIIQKGK